ncbi:hypothetical protein [Shigella boydii]|jgi:hypothetical protein|nr:hypothetical protein [Shigella boydii]MDS1483712.1 hypothetical protein [Shigella boydii]
MNCQLNNPKHAESFPPENTYTAWQTAKENEPVARQKSSGKSFT